MVGAPGAGVSYGISFVILGINGLHAHPFYPSYINYGKGVRIYGTSGQVTSGTAVGYAGDVNGDGINDMILGDGFAQPDGQHFGQSQVVFGGMIDLIFKHGID